MGTSRGQTSGHQPARGSPGSEVLCDCALGLEVSESSLRPTCALGQRVSCQTWAGRWSPNPAPAPQVRPRGRRCQRVPTQTRLQHLQHQRSRRTRPRRAAPAPRTQPEGSALTPSTADPRSDAKRQKASSKTPRKALEPPRSGSETALCVLQLRQRSGARVSARGRAVGRSRAVTRSRGSHSGRSRGNGLAGPARDPPPCPSPSSPTARTHSGTAKPSWPAPGGRGDGHGLAASPRAPTSAKYT